MQETTYKQDKNYTSFDLMKIFGIKKGSWYNVKNKFDLDKFSQKIVDGKQIKFVYSEEAYNILKENYQQKIVKEVKENPKMLVLVQENETLKATLSKYESLSNKFEKMYEEEKKAKEEEMEKRFETEKEAERLRGLRDTLTTNNRNLNEEIERLKNRGFWARLFNK